MKPSSRLVSLLQVTPLTLCLLVFFGVPMLLVVAVSFFDYDDFDIYPDFIWRNYEELFASIFSGGTMFRLYVTTIVNALVVWAITLLIGFTIAYFLVFHVRSVLWQMALFLICTVPFWTSNIIRMISWIPFLGRNGLFNETLIGLGIVDQPLEFLLFSDVAVIIAYVHLYTLFMIVPIFNSMARIDRSLVEAAIDGGASAWRVIREVIIPLSKTGIALGTIFVVTLVMGDFFVIRLMSGGQSGSVVSAMSHEIAQLQYPPAAASAVILLIIVTLTVTAVMRIVDVRKELSR